MGHSPYWCGICLLVEVGGKGRLFCADQSFDFRLERGALSDGDMHFKDFFPLIFLSLIWAFSFLNL